MTPDERKSLQDIGVNIIVHLATVTARTSLLGVCVGLFSISAYNSSKQGLKTYAHRGLFALSILTLVLAWFYATASSAVLFMAIRVPLINMVNPLVQWRGAFNGAAGKPGVLSDCIRSILPFLADSITIWRGIVLFPEQRWSFVVAFFLNIAGMATTFVEVGFFSQDPYALNMLVLLNRLDSTGIVLSFLSNLVATGTIAYGIWLHRRVLVAHLGKEARRQFQIYKILRLLVESGLAYCVFQVLVLIQKFIPVKLILGGSYMSCLAFDNIYIMISAIYPTLIALIVKHAGKFEDTCSNIHPDHEEMTSS